MNLQLVARKTYLPFFRILICYIFMIPPNAYCQEMDGSVKISTDQKLIFSIELMIDTSCNLNLNNIQLGWTPYQLPTNQILSKEVCTWSRVVLFNPEKFQQSRFLYFQKGWWSLNCYVPTVSDSWSKIEMGFINKKEVIQLEVPSQDTLVIYVQYNLPQKASLPSPWILEMTPEKYSNEKAKDTYKYLFLGFIIFPLLFFLAQYLIERDRLNFYYLIFLFGASVNLLTILESTPYFMLTSKLLFPLLPNQIIFRMFVVSVFITLAGLTKYIHHLLNVQQWNSKIYQIGNILIGLFLIVVLIPLIFQQIFQHEHYGDYLPFLRINALLIILYILTTCILAIFKRVQYGITLLIAFAPFVLGALYYALSFVVLGEYSKHHLETVVLIVGFFLSLLLFGLILGIRNKHVKIEKLALEQKTEQLRELDKFKSRFYTNFTHEFRTPLTVIGGVVKLIQNHEQEKKLIVRNCKRLLNTVNQLLDLSRLENKSLKVELVHGNVINFMEYLTESFLSFANQKNINLAFFSTQEEIMMDYDEAKLQHILQNLISNGLKFTPEYGTVKVVADKIKMGKQEFMKLKVTDTGPGIPAENLTHIFERFYQADNSDISHVEGSGIGLSLVKELVNLLEGTIEVKSKLSKGTEFSIILPIRNHPDTQKIDTYQIPMGELENNDNEKLTDLIDTTPNDRSIVLIIEDNSDVREYMISCINQKHLVYAASDGKKGLEKAFEIIPDVVISDVMMPRMDGFSVCKELKENLRTSHIPVILITAKATQEDRVSGLEQGADAYLTKPFDKEELLARLRNMVNLSKRLKNTLHEHGDPTLNYDFREQKEASFLQKVKSIVEKNMDKDHFGTTNLCREIAMSRTQLHRKLKALTDQSTAAYIKRIRLDNAKKMIERTDFPIGEISVQVGFKDFSHFTRSFTKEYGHSPSETRK